MQLAYTVGVVTGTKGARVPVFGQMPQPVGESDMVRIVHDYVFFSNLRVPRYDELVSQRILEELRGCVESVFWYMAATLRI